MTARRAGRSLSFGATLTAVFVAVIVATATSIGYVVFRNGHEAATTLASQTQDSIHAASGC
jgi:hypothetical protein